MNGDVLVFAQVAVVIVFLVGSLATVAVTTVRALTGAKGRAARLSDADGRLEQLQQSIDAIAVEVERIAEAQRFSAKLLAERADAPSEAR